jgi:hypothetical protein
MLLVPPEVAEVVMAAEVAMEAVAMAVVAVVMAAAEADGILAEAEVAVRGTLAAGPRHRDRPRGQVSAAIVRRPSELPPTVQITAGIPSTTTEARRSVRIDPVRIDLAITGMRACGPTRCATH